MKNTNITVNEEEKTKRMPQNIAVPACCDEKSDRIFLHTESEKSEDIDGGVM